MATVDLVALKNLRTAVGVIRKNVFFRASVRDAEQYQSKGDAILYSDYVARKWEGFRWDGAEVAILASGESMNQELADMVRRWRDADGTNRKVIVINTTFRLAPWADVLYACDYVWWKEYYNEVTNVFKGMLWSQDQEVKIKYDNIGYIPSRRSEGLSSLIGIINQGENGGFQAVGIAHQAGAAKAYLLGFDMHGGHWHGKHPDTLDKVNLYQRWLDYFAKMAIDCKVVGFEVINCTKGSVMKCFPTEDYNKVFGDKYEISEAGTIS